MVEFAQRHRDGWTAVLLGLVIAALLTTTWHDAFWGDWHFLVNLTDLGVWRYHHLLYLPCAQLARWVGAAFGLGTESSLLALSTLAVAGSASLTYLAARAARRRQSTSLITAALLATAPAAWFFGGCVEVHALQLCAASLAVLWAVRVSARGAPYDWSALSAAVLWILLVGTHITGVVWSVPLFLFWWSSRRNGRPRHVPAAILLLVAFAALWLFLHSRGTTGSGQASLGLQRLLGHWTLRHLWFEVLRAGGVLHLAAIALVAGLVVERSRPGTTPPALWSRPLVLAALGLYVAFLPFALTLKIFEWGGYYITLLPVSAVLAAGLLERIPRHAGVLALAALLYQGWRGHADIKTWHEHFPDAEWTLPLIESCGGRGVVFTAGEVEATTIFNHSRMTAIAVDDRRAPIDVRLPVFRQAALEVLAHAETVGGRVAITPVAQGLRSEALDALRALLEEQLGPPVEVPGGGFVYPTVKGTNP